MARATAAETADRVELLAGMILAGSNNTECLVCARQTWGVSRAQGYKLVKRAWAQIKDDIDATGIDSAGAAELGHPDAHHRVRTSLEAEEPRRCGGLHPPARSHDRHRIQLSPRPERAPMRCVGAAITNVLQRGFTSHTGKRAEPKLWLQHKFPRTST